MVDYMINKIILMLKKVFGINNNLILPQTSIEGVNDNIGNFNSAVLITNSSNTNKETKKSNSLDDKDLISYVYDDKSNTSVDSSKQVDNLAEETEFTYDEKKAIEMDKKIDYYKKNMDNLYNLSLREILELNFYYKIRIKKLEKKYK